MSRQPHNDKGERRTKAPRRGINRSSNRFESDFSALCLALQSLLAGQAQGLQFEDLFRSGYKIVLSKQDNVLRDRLYAATQEWLTKEVLPGITSSASACCTIGRGPEIEIMTSEEARLASEPLLVKLKQLGERYRLATAMASDIFTYMDRSQTGSTNQLPDSSSILCRCFRDCVLQSPIERESNTTVQEVLDTIILKHLALDRDGDVVDRRLIKFCMDFMLSLSTSNIGYPDDNSYTSCLESDVVQASREFYIAERNMLRERLSPDMYVRYVKKRWADEQELCKSIFPESTAKKVLKVLEEEMNLA